MASFKQSYTFHSLRLRGGARDNPNEDSKNNDIPYLTKANFSWDGLPCFEFIERVMYPIDNGLLSTLGPTYPDGVRSFYCVPIGLRLGSGDILWILWDPGTPIGLRLGSRKKIDSGSTLRAPCARGQVVLEDRKGSTSSRHFTQLPIRPGRCDD